MNIITNLEIEPVHLGSSIRFAELDKTNPKQKEKVSRGVFLSARVCSAGVSLNDRRRRPCDNAKPRPLLLSSPLSSTAMLPRLYCDNDSGLQTKPPTDLQPANCNFQWSCIVGGWVTSIFQETVAARNLQANCDGGYSL